MDKSWEGSFVQNFGPRDKGERERYGETENEDHHQQGISGFDESLAVVE